MRERPPPLPLPAHPRPRHRAPYLDLLDFVLDSLDGIPVYVIPRIHLLRRDGLRSDHCNRGGRAQQGWPGTGGAAGTTCPCPCRGQCRAPGAAAPCGTDSPLSPSHRAPDREPAQLPVELLSRVVPKGTALGRAAQRWAVLQQHPHRGETRKGQGAGVRELPGPSAPNNGGTGSVPARGQAVPAPCSQGTVSLSSPGGAPVTAGRCSAASSLPDVGYWHAEPPRHAGTKTASAPRRFLPWQPAAITRAAARGC